MKQVLQEFVGKYKERIDREIERELSKRMDEVKDISPHLVPVITAMQELSVGGKRMRAMLTILGYQIGNRQASYSVQQEEEIIKAGVVMELFHLGLLIQDDFMDRDTVRRGVSTIQTRYDDLHTGESVAVCAGDYPFGWGMEILSDRSSAISDQARMEAMRVWGKYFTRVGYGQTLDVLKVADEETLLQILSLKSGEYSCVLPLQLGAALAGADEIIMDKLYEFGMEIGWVFQLRDDYLSAWGDSSKTGKPVGNDEREGKHSYALMHGKEETEKMIEEYMNKARSFVSGISGLPGDARKVMEELVSWLGTRDN